MAGLTQLSEVTCPVSWGWWLRMASNGMACCCCMCLLFPQQAAGQAYREQGDLQAQAVHPHTITPTTFYEPKHHERPAQVQGEGISTPSCDGRSCNDCGHFCNLRIVILLQFTVTSHVADEKPGLREIKDQAIQLLRFKPIPV